MVKTSPTNWDGLGRYRFRPAALKWKSWLTQPQPPMLLQCRHATRQGTKWTTFSEGKMPAICFMVYLFDKHQINCIQQSLKGLLFRKLWNDQQSVSGWWWFYWSRWFHWRNIPRSKGQALEAMNPWILRERHTGDGKPCNQSCWGSMYRVAWSYCSGGRMEAADARVVGRAVATLDMKSAVISWYWPVPGILWHPMDRGTVGVGC